MQNGSNLHYLYYPNDIMILSICHQMEYDVTRGCHVINGIKRGCLSYQSPYYPNHIRILPLHYQSSFLLLYHHYYSSIGITNARYITMIITASPLQLHHHDY